jgi:hypothetical protein
MDIDGPSYRATLQDAEDCLLRPPRPKFPWPMMLVLLVFAFMMVYAGQKVETLRYENKLLQAELDTLKGDNNDKR